jgi:hypothetical protein
LLDNIPYTYIIGLSSVPRIADESNTLESAV